MGYYTTFELDVQNNRNIPACGCNENKTRFCPNCGKAFEEAKTLQIAVKDAITEQAGYDPFGDSVKWYGWKDTVAEVSKQFPHDVIQITGYGEEPEDIWRAYFKNGKVQVSKGKIKFEPFDNNKLNSVKK